jgi:hypothetical protein
MLGWTLGTLGRWNEAADPLRLACELSPRQDFCADCADALLRCGRVQEARTAVETAAGLPESDWGQIALARYWAFAGDRERAIRPPRRCFELGGTWSCRVEAVAPLRGHPAYEALRSETGRSSGVAVAR